MKEVEKEVDIWDMIWFICQKWRVLIGAGLVLMVLFGAFGTYKNMTSDSEQQNFDSELSLEELPLADKNRVQQYLLAEEIYQETVEMNESDELLSLDSSNVYKTDAEYVILGNSNNVAIARILEDKIQSLWRSKEDIRRFNEISVVYDSSIVIYEGSKQDKAVVLAVSVYGVDEKDCQDSLSEVKELVKEEKGIHDILGAYQTKYVENESYVTSCDRLQDYINEKKNLEYGKLNNKATVSAALSEAAKEYIENYNQLNAAEEDNQQDEIASNSNEKKGILASISIKYLLLGFIAGIMLAAAVYCVGYVINSKIRFEDDIESEYGLNLLGRVSCEQTGNKLDKWLVNIRRRNIHDFTYQENVEIIASEIKVKALKLGVHKVYATGCTMGERQKSLIKDIAKVLSKSKIELISGNPILFYPEALEESAEIGNILLFEKCNESRYMEMEQEIRKAETRELDIIGVVLVE